MRIFYSWQSDLPNKTNRGLIEDALTAAAKRIAADDSIEIIPVIDRDVRGTTGSPDIATVIFDKIKRSDAVVCDVSIINSRARKRKTANPNVLVEVGYAVGVLGWERVILVMNTAHGKVEDLPFDLRQHLALSYESAEQAQDRATPRNKLSSGLETAIRELIQRADSLSPTLSELLQRQVTDLASKRVLRLAKTLAAMKLDYSGLDAVQLAELAGDMRRFAERISQLPLNAARLLCVINNRTSNRICMRRAALIAEVQEATEMPALDVRQLIQILEARRFVRVDADEGGPWVLVMESNPGEWDILGDLAKHCAARNMPLEELIVHLRFDLLDEVEKV